MLKAKLFLVLIFLSNIAVSQVKDYKGIVFDLFDNRLGDVVVTNLRTQKTVTTDCEGRFIIRANKGDSISITKENYLFHLQKISGNKKMRILLNYDAMLIKKKILAGKSPPRHALYIIDGEPYIRGDSTNSKELGKSKSPNFKVLKGLSSQKMFPEYEGIALVLIFSDCEFPLKIYKKYKEL